MSRQLFEGQRGYEKHQTKYIKIISLCRRDLLAVRWICYFPCTVNTSGIYRALLFYVISHLHQQQSSPACLRSWTQHNFVGKQTRPGLHYLKLKLISNMFAVDLTIQSSPNYFQYTQAKKTHAMHSQSQVLRTGWLLIL